MKAVIMLALLSGASYGARNAILDCRTVKVIESNNHFEEALSTHEYPEISVVRESNGQLEVSVGIILDWESAKGDVIRVIRNTKDTRVVQFRRKEQEEMTYTLRAERNTKGKLVAKLSYKKDDEGEKLLAIAYCK